MNANQLAKRLIESQAVDSAQTWADRLLMRLILYPSLMAYLQDFRFGQSELELDFAELPREALEGIKSLFGLQPEKVKVITFKKDGHPHTGFRLSLPDELIPKAEPLKPK